MVKDAHYTESSRNIAPALARRQTGVDATQVTGIMIEVLAWSQQIISAGEQS